MNHFTLIQCAAHFTAKEYGIARSYKPASDSRSHFHDLSREIVPPAQRPLPPSLADHPVRPLCFASLAAAHTRDLHGNGDSGNTAGMTFAVIPRDDVGSCGDTAVMESVVCGNTAVITHRLILWHSVPVTVFFEISLSTCTRQCYVNRHAYVTLHNTSFQS